MSLRLNKPSLGLFIHDALLDLDGSSSWFNKAPWWMMGATIVLLSLSFEVEGHSLFRRGDRF
jgi:hypothetical protein